jgi:hypothetical protein
VPRLVYAHHLPYPLPQRIGSNQQEAWDFRIGPDGLIWSFLGGTLVRIDPREGTLLPVGKVGGGPIAFAGGKVYLGGTPAIREIEGLTAGSGAQ